jgi:hypothetical protein
MALPTITLNLPLSWMFEFFILQIAVGRYEKLSSDTTVRKSYQETFPMRLTCRGNVQARNACFCADI